MGPLDDTFGFRIARGAQLDGDTERAAERLELIGQPLPALTPLADAALLVPHEQAGHGAERGEHLQHAAQHVVRRPGRHHPAGMQAGEAGHAVDDPQLGGLTEPDRDLHVGLPQIPLGELARPIARALHRIRRHEQRTQLAHPLGSGSSSRAPSRPARRSPSSASSGTRQATHGSPRPRRRPPSPRGARSYFGGDRERNALRTVFRAIPSRSAIALMLNLSARWSRRISAQSSTSIILQTP